MKTLNNMNLRFNPLIIFDAIGQWHQIDAIDQWSQIDAIENGLKLMPFSMVSNFFDAIFNGLKFFFLFISFNSYK